MSDFSPVPQASKSSDDNENCQDYAGALRTISAARGLFLLLLILSLLLHITVYCGSHWTDVFAPVEAAQADLAATSDDAETGAIDAEDVDAGDFARLYYAAQLIMPLAEFIGQISCAALILCYFLAANVSLSGRFGGVRGSISAFFWMVILLALLFPWDRWLGDLRGQVQVPGVYPTFEDVTNLPESFSGLTAQILHYVRFLGFPLLAFIIALLGDRRFARGYRLAQRQIEARLNVRTI